VSLYYSSTRHYSIVILYYKQCECVLKEYYSIRVILYYMLSTAEG